MQTNRFLSGALMIGLAALLGINGCSKGDKEASKQNSEEAATAQPAVMNNMTLVADLESRLKEKPNDPEVLWRLGDAYFDSKQFEQSTAYYKKALEFKPGETDIYNDLGLSLHYMGKPADGLKYIEEGIKKNPYHQRIWLTKGFILAYGMGDLDGAKAAWEKANALNPESQIGKAASEFLAQFNKK